MPRIYVEFSGLDRIGSQCKSAASKVDRIQSDFQHTIRHLDWDVRFASNINSTATQISKKLEQHSNALATYQQFIENARNEYVKLDEFKSNNLLNVYGAGIVVGAAITAVAGSVAVPGVVVVAASGAIIAGVNAGVQALTGKSTTEWISDGILDTGKAIGNKIDSAAKSVAGWFWKSPLRIT